MKILATIPMSPTCGRHVNRDPVEVTVLRLVRTPAARRNGVVCAWHYSADIADPPGVPVWQTLRFGDMDRIRVHVDRRLNPHWQPPEFAAGKNWRNIPEGLL